jgi:hypothetical protein
MKFNAKKLIKNNKIKTRQVVFTHFFQILHGS